MEHPRLIKIMLYGMTLIKFLVQFIVINDLIVKMLYGIIILFNIEKIPS